VSSVGFPGSGSELDPAIVRDATLVVETRAALAAPPAGAPELQGLDESAIHAELGELVAGSRPGRATPGELTLYKSVGVAVQDLAAAALVVAAARERGVGLEIELEEIHA
jgi:ornithine cyclodeaminase